MHQGIQKWTLPVGAVFMMATVLWLSGGGRAVAFDNYFDPADMDESGNCKGCHSGFDQRGPLHDLHVGSQAFTATCEVCHVQRGDNPSTSMGGETGTFSCAGCHGRDYGARGPSGEALCEGFGLRTRHVLRNGVHVCLDCHSPALEPLPETIPPLHYGRTDVHIGDPCNSDGREDGDASGQGLDNDGDGLFDAGDPDCQRDSPSRIVNLLWLPDPPDTLAWTESADADAYQVLRGSLLDLRTQGGSFASGICLDTGTPANNLPDPLEPEPGDGWYYLVRGVAGGSAGTYESDGPGQVGLRDSTATACP